MQPSLSAPPVKRACHCRFLPDCRCSMQEAIILDWAASTSHAWLPHSAFPDSQSAASSAVTDNTGVGLAAGSATASAGIDDLFRTAWSGTRWMDHALQSAAAPVTAPATVAAGLAADAPGAAEVPTSGQDSGSRPAAAGTLARLGNPGRIVVPNAALVCWLQAGVERVALRQFGYSKRRR